MEKLRRWQLGVDDLISQQLNILQRLVDLIDVGFELRDLYPLVSLSRRSRSDYLTSCEISSSEGSTER